MSYFATNFTEKTFRVRKNLCNPWLFLSPNPYPKLKFIKQESPASTFNMLCKAFLQKARHAIFTIQQTTTS